MSLLYMKITYHINFYYNENRIHYLFKIINECSKYRYNTDIFIHTNIDFQITNLIKYDNGIVKLIVHDISKMNPYKLTWMCRETMKKQINDYKIFIYSEDDILIYKETLDYWLDYKNFCFKNNYNLGFLRIEMNEKNTCCTDITKSFNNNNIIHIDNKEFILNKKNPYCAFWIYDKHIMNKFIKSNYYDINNIKGYEIRESSAIGLHGKYTDFFKGTIIPLDKINNCYVHHMQNNYINNINTKYGKLNIKKIYNNEQIDDDKIDDDKIDNDKIDNDKIDDDKIDDDKIDNDKIDNDKIDNDNIDNDNNKSQNKILLNLIVKDNSHILQIGDIGNKLEKIIIKTVKKNKYLKIHTDINNIDFIINYEKHHNIIFNTLIIGDTKKIFHFKNIDSLYKHINNIFVYYQNNTRYHNESLRKNLFNNHIFSIGYKLINDVKYKDNCAFVNNQYLESESFIKGNICGLDNIKLNLSYGKDYVNRTTIINHLITKFKLKTYVEIGIRDGSNFNKIKINNKIGIDPFPIMELNNNIHVMTSDDYFKLNQDKNIKYDIILIDGFHLEEQVDKDIENSLNHLNDGGFIIMHDCNPPTKFHQRKNYELKNGKTPFWNGTVWRSYVKLRMNNPNLNMRVVNTDWGVGIIQKGKQKCIKYNENFEYLDLQKDREYYLNLISIYDLLCN